MILIIQNGYITPNISHYIEDPWEIIKSFEKDVSEINVNEYDLVVILGGHQSVTQINEYPYLLKVVKLIEKCLELDKPLLGICLGCQLIAYALGCEIASTGKLNLGYDVNILGYDGIYRCHIDYIKNAKNINILESFDNMPYLYSYKNFVIGIQFHPDITPECARNYSNRCDIEKYSIKNSNVIHEQNKIIINRLINALKLKKSDRIAIDYCKNC